MNRQNVATGSVPDNVKGGKGKPREVREVPIPPIHQVVTFPVIESSISVGMTITIECRDGVFNHPRCTFYEYESWSIWIRCVQIKSRIG